MNTDLVAAPSIERSLRMVRGQKVLLDEDPAHLYGVPVKRLNEQVRPNAARFPGDFMFQLDEDEVASLGSHIATLKKGRGEHRTYAPMPFTEQGVAMLSSVLRVNHAPSLLSPFEETFLPRELRHAHSRWSAESISVRHNL